MCFRGMLGKASACYSPASMPAYPIQLTSLSGRRVLVAGGGDVAAQKLDPLVAAGAKVHLIAPEVSEQMQHRMSDLHCFDRRQVQTDDVAGAALVVAATDDRDVNRRLAAEARRLGILVNAADDPEACDFYSPAILRRGPVTITVGTDGGSPLLAAQLRRLLEVVLPKSATTVAELFVRARRRGLKGLARRKELLTALTDPIVSTLVDRGETEAAAARLETILTEEEETFPPGSVALVGAGPGSKELLTLRALDRIRRAEVLLHDALVEQEVLALASPNATVVPVGRRAKCDRKRRFPQELTHRLMVNEARAGRRVVRLHAGDAFVFGRGGEEIDALLEAGVPYQIVPGVSAAVAAPAVAGVPLTRRGEALGFSVRTGHTRTGYSRGELPTEQETIVVLMGLGGVAEIMEGLAAEGRPLDTPAVAVSNATRQGQRIVCGTIADLADKVREAALEGPATLIVGEVAKRAASHGHAAAATDAA